MSAELPGSKAVVIGAGQMGLGIAHAFAVAGAEVALVDVGEAQLAKARSAIAAILEGAVKLKKLEEGAAGAALSRLAPSTDLAGVVRDADIVVETASENLKVKLDLLATVDGAAREDAIVTTNTSALSVTELGATMTRPERFAGMHFFNPVHKMKLLEIVKGLPTSPETVAILQAWGAALGKTTIVVNEAPGFTTSRMSALAGNEAMHMLAEGVASAEDIDTALRLGFGHPMGPLELGDLTGWDTRLSVLQYLQGVLGDRFRPNPLIIKMVKAGRVGRKVGRGVYEYRDGVKVPGSGLKAS